MGRSNQQTDDESGAELDWELLRLRAEQRAALEGQQGARELDAPRELTADDAEWAAHLEGHGQRRLLNEQAAAHAAQRASYVEQQVAACAERQRAAERAYYEEQRAAERAHHEQQRAAQQAYLERRHAAEQAFHDQQRALAAELDYWTAHLQSLVGSAAESSALDHGAEPFDHGSVTALSSLSPLGPLAAVPGEVTAVPLSPTLAPPSYGDDEEAPPFARRGWLRDWAKPLAFVAVLATAVSLGGRFVSARQQEQQRVEELLRLRQQELAQAAQAAREADATRAAEAARAAALAAEQARLEEAQPTPLETTAAPALAGRPHGDDGIEARPKLFRKKGKAVRRGKHRRRRALRAAAARNKAALPRPHHTDSVETASDPLYGI